MDFFKDLSTNTVKKVRLGAVGCMLIAGWSLFQPSSALEQTLLWFSITFLLLALVKELMNRESGLFQGFNWKVKLPSMPTKKPQSKRMNSNENVDEDDSSLDAVFESEVSGKKLKTKSYVPRQQPIPKLESRQVSQTKTGGSPPPSLQQRKAPVQTKTAPPLLIPKKKPPTL